MALPRFRPAAPSRTALLLALCLVGWPTAAAGQAGDDPPAPAIDRGEVSPWLVGASLGLPGIRTDPFLLGFTVGIHAAYLPPGPLGLDLCPLARGN